jgi:hypothetical protein
MAVAPRLGREHITVCGLSATSVPGNGLAMPNGVRLLSDRGDSQFVAGKPLRTRYWPRRVPQNLPYSVTAKRFRCGACGSRRVSLYPATETQKWRGHRQAMVSMPSGDRKLLPFSSS